MARLEISPKTLAIWTVYDSPTDYPGIFVARLYLIGSEGGGPTELLLKSETLSGIRNEIQRVMPYVVDRDPRQEGDDPKIVECWL